MSHSANVLPRSVLAGGAAADITPRSPTFLYGYPRVPRASTGVHDRLLASAFYVSDGLTDVLIVQADVIWLSKGQVAEARRRIVRATGIPAHCIMITASHTHSGPGTVSILSNVEDPVVPPPDDDYLEQLICGIVGAAGNAVGMAEPAQVVITSANCSMVGGNRLDPAGPRMTTTPVVAARSADHNRWIGLMFINPVHPTVLHEDSTLVSGDFPAMCRLYLQSHLVGADCPVLCHLGAAGNQSPRYVAESHTFSEAKRLGELLGRSIEHAIRAGEFASTLTLGCEITDVQLPIRQMASLDEAKNDLRNAQAQFSLLRKSGATPALIRTAECAVFGAEESLTLSQAATSDVLDRVQKSCQPAEVQKITIGDITLIGWPGEVFVEFALQLHERYARTFVITLANGELQGYLVTADAVQQKCYEAGNALFASPAAGEKLLNTTLALLSGVGSRSVVRGIE